TGAAKRNKRAFQLLTRSIYSQYESSRETAEPSVFESSAGRERRTHEGTYPRGHAARPGRRSGGAVDAGRRCGSTRLGPHGVPPLRIEARPDERTLRALRTPYRRRLRRG